MNYKPFDLQKALAGDPVVTVEGLKVTEVAFFTTVQDGYFPLIGVAGGAYIYARADGTTNTEFGDEWGGLFMAPKKVTYYFVSCRNECGRYPSQMTTVEADADNTAREWAKGSMISGVQKHTIEIEE